MTCMRMALIHPLLPGGREYTIKFSPSRRHRVGLLAKDISETCVFCQRFPSQGKEKKDDELLNFATVTEDEELQDADFDAAGKQRGKKDETEKKGKLVPLDFDICHATGSCRHFIHEKCLKQLQNDSEDELKCPRCKDLQSRLSIDLDRATEIPHETYCEHITFGPYARGIKASAKIQAIVKWATEIPKGDKAIVYSFYKTSLDILEGIFVEHLGIECARFDGDFPSDERSTELAHFKSSNTCRILLASVQSCGVGLNIVEANHVAFLDRWFNPSVHEQAEDRCHRLKQTKEVKVTYFDASMTVDQVCVVCLSMQWIVCLFVRHSHFIHLWVIL